MGTSEPSEDSNTNKGGTTMTNAQKGLLVRRRVLGYLMLNAHMGCSRWFLAQRLGYTREESVAVVIHNINKTRSRKIVTRDDRYYHPAYLPKTVGEAVGEPLSSAKMRPWNQRKRTRAPAMVFFGDDSLGYRDGCRRVMPHGIGR
jgi:hypothetical protein